MNFDKVEIRIKGKPTLFPSIKVDKDIFVITGRFVKTATIHKEWSNDVSNPEAIADVLRKHKIDIFTFWQRLPDITPRYNYHMEWHAVSAIPITTYDHWLSKQINSDTRKKIKRASNRGVEIKQVPLDDKFIQGALNIYNETSIRRGKRFWHYGKDFNTAKKELSEDLESSDFISAYFNGELIGYVKLNYYGEYANPGHILSLLKYRNEKYTNNALIAKAVELCAEKKMQYLTYTDWRKGSQADFLRRHGFEKVLLPRYFIPLTIKGNLCLQLHLHRGIRSLLPEKMLLFLLNCRKRFYEKTLTGNI